MLISAAMLYLAQLKAIPLSCTTTSGLMAEKTLQDRTWTSSAPIICCKSGVYVWCFRGVSLLEICIPKACNSLMADLSALWAPWSVRSHNAPQPEHVADIAWQFQQATGGCHLFSTCQINMSKS